MWICGPRRRGNCKPGARTVCLCLHAFSAISCAGYFSHTPLGMKSTFYGTYILDPGDGLPMAHKGIVGNIMENTIS